jgi:alcohol dehydrogenase (cytochrome c)
MRPLLPILLALTLLAAPARGAELAAFASSALGDWPVAAHGYDGNRYVNTNLLARSGVTRLRPAWTFTMPLDDAMMEASPVVADGTLYITTGRDDVYALDARTGRQRWVFHYGPQKPIALKANRGVALLDGRVFFGTLDGHVVALEASTGKLLWNVAGVHDASNSFYTMAPLAYGNLVMIGVSNGDWGGKGYVSAFDVATGKRVWDWETIPGRHQPGNETWKGTSWKRGGGAVWGGLTLDPVANLLFLNVGNPQPDFLGAGHLGDNLYTDSLVALDIRTSRPQLKWYRQYIPHDTHDWDAAMPPVHFMGVVQGTRRELLAAGDKGGNFWVIDATNGTVLEHTAVTTQTVFPADPALHGSVACPGSNGGVQYNGGAYLPETNMFYVPSVDQCQIFTTDGNVRYLPGTLYQAGKTEVNGASTGWLTAIDIGTGTVRWRVHEPLPAIGGALAFSGGLVFTGQLNGDLEAYDARTGAKVWHAPTGAPIKAAPAAYEIDGKLYIAVASGRPGRNWELPGVPAGDFAPRVTVFTLR